MRRAILEKNKSNTRTALVKQTLATIFFISLMFAFVIIYWNESLGILPLIFVLILALVDGGWMLNNAKNSLNNFNGEINGNAGNRFTFILTASCIILGILFLLFILVMKIFHLEALFLS
jgi:hypothetical protein